MVDKTAQNKQIDGVTDKVKETTVKLGASDKPADISTLLGKPQKCPDDKDVDLLIKSLVSLNQYQGSVYHAFDKHDAPRSPFLLLTSC